MMGKLVVLQLGGQPARREMIMKHIKMILRLNIRFDAVGPIARRRMK